MIAVRGNAYFKIINFLQSADQKVRIGLLAKEVYKTEEELTPILNSMESRGVIKITGEYAELADEHKPLSPWQKVKRFFGRS